MKPNRQPVPASLRAFTLIELLTVTAIIGILAAIVIPTVGKVRNNAKNTRCVANLRQLAIAAQLHAGEKRFLPSTRDTGDFCPNPALLKNTTAFWIEQLAPHMSSIAQTTGDNRVCPSYTELQEANYYRAGYALNRRPFLAEASDSTDISYVIPAMVQRPARTILILESSDWHANGYNVGGLPANWVGDRHGDKSNYAFMDGSVRSLSGRESLPLMMRPGTVPAAYQ